MPGQQCRTTGFVFVRGRRSLNAVVAIDSFVSLMFFLATLSCGDKVALDYSARACHQHLLRFVTRTLHL